MGQGVRNFFCFGEQIGVCAVAQFVSTKQSTEVANGRLENTKRQCGIDSALAIDRLSGSNLTVSFVRDLVKLTLLAN
jgi:hypothetical protein